MISDKKYRHRKKSKSHTLFFLHSSAIAFLEDETLLLSRKTYKLYIITMKSIIDEHVNKVGTVLETFLV
jgi:hypothetical protein